MLGAIKFGSSNRSSEVHFEVRKFVSKFPPNFRTSKRNWELGNELRNRVLKSELKSTIMCVLCTSAACYDSTKCIINTHDGSFSLQLYRSMFCAAVISGARAIKPLQGYIIPFSFDILISTVRYSVRSGVVLTCQNIRGDIRMP
jgi:hypothetical protein